MRAVVGGLIGGAIGAAIWAAVAGFTGYEVGWIAWGIGGFVGYGVAAGNQDGHHAPTAAGVLALVIAAVAIVGGKYAGVQLMMPSDEELVEMFVEGFTDDELVISYLADAVVEEMERAGETVVWPADVDPEVASTEAEYPPSVWAQAGRRWDGMTEAERAAYREERIAETRSEVETNLPQIRAMIAGSGFAGSFSPMDLIFFGLAMTTAFGLASGSRKGAGERATEYAEAVQLAMIQVMIADGDVDEAELRIVCDVHREMTGAEISPDVVRAKATLAASTGRDLEGALMDLAPHLSAEGKANVLAAAVKVAVADGEFERAEQEVLSAVATALGMSAAEMRNVVDGLKQMA